MSDASLPQPTERELRALRILWQRGECTVRAIYETMREELPIVQNTVQALLRTMSEKGLVTFRKDGRAFVYRPLARPDETRSRLVDTVLARAFDGALDQLVASAVSARKPSPDELARLRQLLEALDRGTPEQRS